MSAEACAKVSWTIPFLPPHTECICELWPTNNHVEMEADPEQLGKQPPRLSKTHGSLSS